MMLLRVALLLSLGAAAVVAQGVPPIAEFDADESGRLEPKEFAKFLQQTPAKGAPKDQIRSMFKNIDSGAQALPPPMPSSQRRDLLALTTDSVATQTTTTACPRTSSMSSCRRCATSRLRRRLRRRSPRRRSPRRRTRRTCGGSRASPTSTRSTVRAPLPAPSFLGRKPAATHTATRMARAVPEKENGDIVDLVAKAKRCAAHTTAAAAASQAS